MMELRRKIIRPISLGDLCTIKSDVNDFLVGTDDYIKNGNLGQISHNYLKKIHIADVEVFYCCNDNPFNSSELLEVIPMRFKYDSNYSNSSFKIVLSKRMKLTMKREDLSLVMNPKNQYNNFSILENNLLSISKKFNLNLKPWRDKHVSR